MELNNSKIKIKAKNLNVYYGKKQALFDINLDKIFYNVEANILDP